MHSSGKSHCIFNFLEYTAARLSAPRNHEDGVTDSTRRRASRSRRHAYKIKPIASVGPHTQNISLPMTASPRDEKNAAPIGDTRIGRHGKKYRVGLNGERNEMAIPPLVIASSRLCET